MIRSRKELEKKRAILAELEEGTRIVARFLRPEQKFVGKFIRVYSDSFVVEAEGRNWTAPIDYFIRVEGDENDK